MKKAAPIPHNDWLTALHELEGSQEEDPDALSTSELALLWTCNRSTALRRVQILIQRGRAKQVLKCHTSSQGHYVKGIAYKLIEPHGTA